MALIADVVAGNTINASWGNAVRDATVQVTTSGARPSAPAEGMVIYETDTDYLMFYTGSAWVHIANSGAWTSYTPTWGGAVTIGNGTSTGAFTRVGKTVHFRAKLVWGSTSSMAAASATVTLPVTSLAAGANAACRVDFYDDSSVATGGLTMGFLVLGTTTATLWRTAAGGSYVDSAALSSTIPFSWAAPDEIRVSGTYEAA